MHHALSLHEIRACIAHSVGVSADRSGQALVALACTNQMLSEVALDQIWRMPPIRELVNHMPAESYILSSHSKFNIPTQGTAVGAPLTRTYARLDLTNMCVRQHPGFPYTTSLN
jgi:hypothetical protein